MSKANEIVNEMMGADAFSRWMGIEVVEVQPGYAFLRMEVRDEMVNGFGVAHGGIAFSLADSALAFASNGHGRVAVALNDSITFMRPVNPGDILTAKAEELHRGGRTAHYQVSIHNQDDERIAQFQGTVYITSKEH